MALSSKPSIDDVARRAGVSTATVSRSLNEPHRVKPATLEAVRKVIAELGYAPHFGGRALASNKTNTIGAIIPTMDNAIFARGLQALQETLSENGVTLLVASSGYDPDQEAQQIRTMLGRGIDGLLLIGKARPEATYALLRQHAVPVVIAWTYVESSAFPSVGFDNRAAAATVAATVLGYGHRRVAMIAGITEGNDRASERVDGVRQTLTAAGLELLAGGFFEARYDLDEAAGVMQKLMALDVPPTAVICGNDVLAAGALMYARQGGFSVPTDVSIVGFDNIDLASVVEPPLTTLHVPHRRMGQKAAELLLALRNGEDNVRSIQIETRIVIRGSLGKPKESQIVP